MSGKRVINLHPSPLNPLIMSEFGEADFRSQNEDAQEWRWIVYTVPYRNTATGLDRPAVVVHGEPALVPIEFRCSDRVCSMQKLGDVWVVSPAWREHPFVWAQTVRLESGPTKPPRIRETHMVLDTLTNDLRVLAECTRHGLRGYAVKDVLDRLPMAVDHARKSLARGKNTSYCLEMLGVSEDATDDSME